jgi:protoporphyrin/coproporphyrin ferrochelatase
MRAIMSIGNTSRITPDVGVLLLNLGTPDAAEPAAIRTYLKEFLSDRRVVELPTAVWQPILRGLVLTRRPYTAAHAYQSIWTDRGSPLAFHTQDQATALADRLGPNVLVDYAMRYGNPSIACKMEEFIALGVDKILIAPLYPQYSGATTATALDRAFGYLSTVRSQPSLRTLPAYFASESYIDALARSTLSSLAALPFEPDVLVASFHGMPERTRQLGDPYYDQCLVTTNLLSEALGQTIIPSFQSRFGPSTWFSPATDKTLSSLPMQGVRSVAVITPGFSVDCVETLEEIGMRGRDSFIEAGGVNFVHLPCLNASRPGMDMLETLIRRELAGWVAPEDGHRVALARAA